jgi:hypothetical protein
MIPSQTNTTNRKKVMTDQEKRKAKATIKIAAGTTRCISGCLLILGHGLLSIAIRSPGAQCSIGRALIQSGEQTVKDGVAEWNE